MEINYSEVFSKRKWKKRLSIFSLMIFVIFLPLLIIAFGLLFLFGSLNQLYNYRLFEWIPSLELFNIGGFLFCIFDAGLFFWFFMRRGYMGILLRFKEGTFTKEDIEKLKTPEFFGLSLEMLSIITLFLFLLSFLLITIILTSVII